MVMYRSDILLLNQTIIRNSNCGYGKIWDNTVIARVMQEGLRKCMFKDIRVGDHRYRCNNSVISLCFLKQISGCHLEIDNGHTHNITLAVDTAL
jgi:hypothetical protein